jgi:hypothetical protein
MASETRHFDEATVAYEAYIPMQRHFEGVPMSEVEKVLDEVVIDFKKSTPEFTRKSWDIYFKQANWQHLAEKALTK